MNRGTLLTTASLLAAVLLSLHISQDIILGLDKAGINHLVGVALILAIACGALLLPHRRVGKVLMLLGGAMAAAMLPLHMRNGLRPELLQADGATLFVTTLYLLGVTGFFTIIVAALELWKPSR